MKKYLLAALCLIISLHIFAEKKYHLVSSLSQNGITVSFNKEYRSGRFANGDFWIEGPVTFTHVTHDSSSNTISGHVGIMINPRMSQKQGYDKRINGYMSSLAKKVPFTAIPGDSVVLTTSLEKIGGNEGTFLADAIVLTIVDHPQTGDKFRPPYTRPVRVRKSSNDPLIFSTDNINWGLLPSLDKPGTTPSLEETEKRIERVWLDHWNESTFLSSRIHPLNNMNDYGRDIAADESEAAMQLMLNYSREEKRKLLISMIQIGIDFYGNALDGGRWYADGGHSSGRKFPIIFAGLMLNNKKFITIKRRYRRKNGKVTGFQYRFGEDGQTYYYDDPYLPEFANRITNNRAVGPARGTIVKVRGVRGWIDKRNGGKGNKALWRISGWLNNGTYVAEYEHLDINYWQDFAGGNDSHPKFDSYRRCCTSKAWIGFGLAINLMGSKSRAAWNHNAFFDYIYRFMSENDENAGKLFENRYQRNYHARQGISTSKFVDEMWEMCQKRFVTFRK